MTIDRGPEPVITPADYAEVRRLLRWLWVLMPHGVPPEDRPRADPEYDARLLREERVAEVRGGD